MENILTYVESAIRMPGNKLSEAFLSEHILVVKEFALQLGQFYNANASLLSIAALMHDISAVLDIQTLPLHHFKSAEIAEGLLKSNGYQPEDIEIVKNSIEKHIMPLQEKEGNIYEVIISNADAMAQIARPNFWMFFTTQVRNLNQETALNWYSEKVESNWNHLIPTAKELIAKEYFQTLEVINQFRESWNQTINASPTGNIK